VPAIITNNPTPNNEEKENDGNLDFAKAGQSRQ
jgi:hypothetical protein